MDFESVPTATNHLVSGSNPYAAEVQFLRSAYSVTSAWPGSPGGGAGSGLFFRDPTVYGSGTRGAMLMWGDDDGQGNTSLVFNVAGGFSAQFSMLYGALVASGTVQVFDGLDGQGQLLGGRDISGTAPCIDPKTGALLSDFVCNWGKAEINFSGTAHSVRIFGSNAAFFLDDVQLGQAGGGTLPEPGSMALSLAALGLMAWRARSRKP
ncbi:hypothetical protein HNP55_003368 [Paucibacter oligotrophus]|uniref:Uncharacterized protein n=1 Tax=Roseateles oligotrophus TaxID=1769250 RepID=A0A840L8D4_9BURK|nr:hypothetical protein [Roseateles oligotrophus]MBB4844824.1 hypothetical protein [Roseateles oligotrophus]